MWREDQEAQKILHARIGAKEKHGEAIRRFCIEMDGMMARLRRGSVPMEKQQREGWEPCVWASQDRSDPNWFQWGMSIVARP